MRSGLTLESELRVLEIDEASLVAKLIEGTLG